jgi:hypothetical protein
MSRRPRDTALVIAPPVCSIPGLQFPEPCELHPCSKCGRMIWVRVRLREHIERQGQRLKCLCFGECRRS